MIIHVTILTTLIDNRGGSLRRRRRQILALSSGTPLPANLYDQLILELVPRLHSTQVLLYASDRSWKLLDSGTYNAFSQLDVSWYALSTLEV